MVLDISNFIKLFFRPSARKNKEGNGNLCTSCWETCCISCTSRFADQISLQISLSILVFLHDDLLMPMAYSYTQAHTGPRSIPWVTKWSNQMHGWCTTAVINSLLLYQCPSKYMYMQHSITSWQLAHSMLYCYEMWGLSVVIFKNVSLWIQVPSKAHATLSLIVEMYRYCMFSQKFNALKLAIQIVVQIKDKCLRTIEEWEVILGVWWNVCTAGHDRAAVQQKEKDNLGNTNM